MKKQRFMGLILGIFLLLSSGLVDKLIYGPGNARIISKKQSIAALPAKCSTQARSMGTTIIYAGLAGVVGELFTQAENWFLKLGDGIRKRIEYGKIRRLFNGLLREIRRSNRKMKRTLKKIRVLKRKRKLRKRQKRKLRKMIRILSRMKRKYQGGYKKLLRFKQLLEKNRRKIKDHHYRRLKRRLAKIRKGLNKLNNGLKDY